jgi:uncharacterized DUF497 family protein
MEFDWNPAKCAKNIAERGIDFAEREQRRYG